MKIGILGLGYVGCVTCACLAQDDNNSIFGIDPEESKVHSINNTIPTVYEPHLGSLFDKLPPNRRVNAFTSLSDLDVKLDAIYVCVGTPLNPSNGLLDMSHIYNVINDIKAFILRTNSSPAILVRSTLNPHTCNYLISLLEDSSGLINGTNFQLVYNPEFLREGSAVADWFNPPFTIYGRLSDSHDSILSELALHASSEIIYTDIEVAELLKPVCNSFHALKVSFANEIGTVCRALGIDSQKLMNIFCSDYSLNISPKYLTPGFAYGGSCLPKDLQSICTVGMQNFLELPLLSSVKRSNQVMIDSAKSIIESTGFKRICFIGLSFKPNTDDLRNSPYLELAEYFIGKGFTVVVFDPILQDATLVGSNLAFSSKSLPHLRSVLTDKVEVSDSDVFVVANLSYFDHLSAQDLAGKTVLDLTSQISSSQHFQLLSIV